MGMNEHKLAALLESLSTMATTPILASVGQPGRRRVSPFGQESLAIHRSLSDTIYFTHLLGLDDAITLDGGDAHGGLEAYDSQTTSHSSVVTVEGSGCAVGG